jgi:tRNA A-37 threonylcarbamoyl transferase component Bud32
LNAKVSATKVCPGCSARYPPDALFCPNDGSPLSATPLGDRDSDAGLAAGTEGSDSYLGREISGHIEIRKLAGVGAMGRVYRAFQKGIDRDVAVKVLHRELSANQQLVARFHREAKVASRLQHPNVVQVHLAGQLPDGAMYIVMEYLDGLSLQSALAAAGGPLPLERALHIALQICDAAGEAHSQGVVHRDIKPENVMLIRRGDDPDFVKVLDFGIARLNWGEQSMATAAGLIFGTARYISPEGAQGEAVGPEGDVYATATLLYQMLAGRTPFEGEQAVALLVQQIHDLPPPIRSIPASAHLPEALATVIMRNLSKTPSDRAPDARTFGRALVEAAKTVGLSPEDLVPRSSLFVPPQRLSDPGAFMAPRVVDASAVVALADTARALETVRDPSIPDFGAAGALPLGVKTQKWSPVSVPAAALATPVASQKPPVTQIGAPLDAFPERPRKSVDVTLDDSTSIRLPPVGDPSGRPSERVRTEPAMPIVAPRMMPAPTPTPSPAVNIPYVPATASAGLKTTPDDRPPRAAQFIGATLEPPPRRSIWGILAVFFLIGVLGALGVLGVARGIGPFAFGSRPGSLDDAVLHADDALRHSRWDTPPGDNVRDLTNDALTKWPHDPRLMDLRARATDELVKEAVGRKFAGDLPGALHLARLANELDPTDTTAQHLVEEYARVGVGSTVDAATSAVHVPVPTPTSHSTPRPPSSAAVLPKLLLESSAARSRVGQPVTFTARVSGSPAKALDGPRFVISGPGLTPETKLGNVPESTGVYQTTFTGSEPGRYDVTFEVKADGTTLRSTKSVMFESDAEHSPVNPVPSTAPSLPPAIPSGKWL